MPISPFTPLTVDTMVAWESLCFSEAHKVTMTEHQESVRGWGLPPHPQEEPFASQTFNFAAIESAAQLAWLPEENTGSRGQKEKFSVSC